MKTQETAACGVWIEFLDARGNTVAQQIVDAWQGRPVPDRGDYVEFAVAANAQWLRGTVIARRFDRQRAADGSPRLWVRLVVRVDEASLPVRTASRRSTAFSRN